MRSLHLLAVVGAAVVAAFVAVAVSAPASRGAGACTPDAAWPATHADLAAQVLVLVNKDRASHGLPALVTSTTLRASAAWKARHMAAYGYMAHDDPAPPVARTWFQRIQACGYSSSSGENLARGYPDAGSVVAAWLADPPHRANIEGPWRATGVAAAVSAAGSVYWAEDFGAVADTAPARSCVVPRVVGATEARAVRLVSAAGCRAKVERVRARGVSAGRVAWQSPRAGVRMPRGSVVVVAVRR